MLDDLFSHKIHASDLENWKRKLVKLAQVFEAFDGQTFKRDEFDKALLFLSPTTARSPFRDIYSIYMSILGVGHIVWEQNSWKCRISETAHRYLTGLKPNVEAFCRLQLSLYQRPDGRGQQYNKSVLVLEHQTQTKTLNLIYEQYKVCPLRLILIIFEAKARLHNCLQDDITVTPEEVYTLANSQALKSNSKPSVEAVADALEAYNNNSLNIVRGEKRFPFLEATGLLAVDYSNNLKLYPYNDHDLNFQRDKQIEVIKSLHYFFEDFNQCTNIKDICNVLESGAWAEYFDACKTLSAREVQGIAGEVLMPRISQQTRVTTSSDVIQQMSRLTKRKYFGQSQNHRQKQKRQPQQVNPEATRVLMERRNAWHELLVEKMRKRIQELGFEPWETELIDLGVDVEVMHQLYPQGLPIRGTYLENADLPYFKLGNPSNLTFIFEMKSSDDSIVMEQVRKAVSQLYEYRYIHYNEGYINEYAILVLVLQNSLSSQSWLREYLLNDRHIAACWLQSDDSFDCFDECRPILEPIISKDIVV